MSNRAPLPESVSLLLDIVRFGAAIMVVIAHLTHAEFHFGYSDRQLLGDIAVPVFFVLSGFVIRYVTKTRETTAREYFIDRASRIYSVALPAMVFTLLVSGICIIVNHDMFMRDWSATFSHPVQRIVFNLLFVSQAWGHNTIPFVNSPFWSLGYECVYYVFYGLVFFGRGWKRIAGCLVVAGGIGPQVLFLLPVWWVGCWVYDLYVRVRKSHLGIGLLILCGSLLFLGLTGVEAGPASIFWAIAGTRNPLEVVGIPAMRATMFALAVGLFAAVGLLALLLGMDYWKLSSRSRWAKGVRRIADGTFAIYLMHYPFLVLLLFLGALRPGWTNILAAVGTCGVLIMVAVPLDTLKLWMRRRLRLRFPERSAPLR